MDNLRGVALMTAAMAAFAVEDVFIKAATRTLPVGVALLAFGLCGAAAFAALAWRAGLPLFPPQARVRVMATRAAFEVAGRAGYTLAVALAPLATASAILQATPLVVTLGAAVVFGERVGPLRWAAVAAGFAGVLLVVRPGADAMDPAALFAVAGMVGFACRDLATRAAPAGLSHLQLGVYGFLAILPAGAGLLAVSGGLRAPDAAEGAALAGAVAFGVAGYYWLTAAMRTGEIGAVAPFRYTRLVFAMALGVAVFGERPDAATLAGAAIIVAAGLAAALARRR
jgi:drug/metabolite transporter (DMT)-like permease